MTLEQALEKANDGGWKTTLEPYRSLSEAIALALLDPLFWQALGKSMGWGSGCNVCLKDGITHSYANGWADECEKPKEHLTENHKYPWQINWHRLIDHLAKGGSIESYFEKL